MRHTSESVEVVATTRFYVRFFRFQDEFPEQPSHVRRAIALGRLQLDPLPVLAALCGPRAEVLSLPLTEMQGCLQDADRLRVIEQVMVTATAQVREVVCVTKGV